MFSIRFIHILIISCFSTGYVPELVSGEAAPEKSKVDSLVNLLPEKLVTIVDKTLDDQFAEIEKLASKLPNMDKKKVFLITLPVENFIEDIYFPANRPAIIYPQVLFLTINEELQKGKSKKEIARLLVKLQKKNAFEKMYLARKKALK